jgi:hypothetical protein
MKRLSDAEIQRYHDDGLVIPDYRLPDAILARMQAEVDRLIERNPGVRPEQLSGAHNPWGQSAQMVGSQTFLDLCLFPEILDMVELTCPRILGPRIPGKWLGLESKAG